MGRSWFPNGRDSSGPGNPQRFYFSATVIIFSAEPQIMRGTMDTHTLPEPFITAIKQNCDISDSEGSAIFSICGMALRLRDLNKWEKGLSPWEENDPAELLAWIDAKEQVWEKVNKAPFKSLPLAGETFDPFDTPGLNRFLEPMGLFYGAGYAHSLKPTFFLARIDNIREIQGIRVLTLGEERVRDLLTIPALNQDNAVLFRRDAAGLFLWDQMAYLKKSGQRFLKFALRSLGLPRTCIETRKAHFEAILENQARTYIHHEIGEILETEFERPVFQEVVSEFPHTPVELLARTVRDLLADTGPRGTLARIITTRDASALGFYAAFQDGLFRPLFPGLRPAVEKFVSDRDWEGIDQARRAGFATARQYAQDLINLFVEGKDTDTPDQTAEKINKKLVEPLTR